MLRLPKFINKTLSIRLSLIVVSAMAVLLMVSLIVMLFFSRKALKEEALQKASHTLESTVQRIDNILLSVEQSTGNVYFHLINNLDKPDMMYEYSRQLVESNPCVDGCAIAFKKNYYKGHEYFMAYYRRNTHNIPVKESWPDPTLMQPSHQLTSEPHDSTVVKCDSFGNRPYTEQTWFTKPMAAGKPGWLNPLKDMDVQEEPIITFCLPLYDGQETVGIIGVDVSLSLLSHIVLATKPSANSYCTLLSGDGTYMVHPDSTKLHKQSALLQASRGADYTAIQAAQAMVAGKTGYMPFTQNGEDYYVFYKPFKRAATPGRAVENPNWSVGIIYPDDDIFGDYNNLFYYVLAIAIGGLLLLFLLCRIIVHSQLTPLILLTASAQRIAKGNYSEPIPDSRQNDEIGRLQDNFQKMQKTLAAHIGELDQLTATIKKRGDELRSVYEQAQKADRMKTSFLHNMTNQMIGPAEAIVRDVAALSDNSQDRQHDTGRLVGDIHSNGNTITDLLKNLINISDDEKLLDEVPMNEEEINGGGQTR